MHANYQIHSTEGCAIIKFTLFLSLSFIIFTNCTKKNTVPFPTHESTTSFKEKKTIPSHPSSISHSVSNGPNSKNTHIQPILLTPAKHPINTQHMTALSFSGDPRVRGKNLSGDSVHNFVAVPQSILATEQLGKKRKRSYSGGFSNVKSVNCRNDNRNKKTSNRQHHIVRTITIGKICPQILQLHNCAPDARPQRRVAMQQNGCNSCQFAPCYDHMRIWISKRTLGSELLQTIWSNHGQFRLSKAIRNNIK